MNQKNILGGSLQICSTNQMTGFHRDGYCRPNRNDKGKHYVCGVMNQDFLDFTASKGNDLSSVVKSGDNWCLCQNRWLQAYNAGKAPKVIKEATNSKIRQKVKDAIKQKSRHRKKRTRKKRGGWSRAKAREEGHVEGDNVYYQCSNRYPPQFIPQDWRYKDDIEISNESASQGKPTAQRFKIIKMIDWENSIGPVLRVEETTTPSSNRRFDQFAEIMCDDGFKPVKKNEGKIGAGRKKKTRKKRGGTNRCAVCLEDGLQDDDNTIRLSCQHFFCKNCIRGWLVSNNTCPMCRGVVSQEDRNRVGGLEEYPANLFLHQQIESDSDSDDDYLGDILAEAAETAQWYHSSNVERWINSDDPHNQFIDNDYGGWKEDGTYVPGMQSYRGGIVSLIHNPRARQHYIIVNYNGNQYRVVGAKVRQYLVPGSSNILIEQEGEGPEGGHIVYEKISRISKAVGFNDDYEREDDWWEALRTPVTEEDILNDINAIPEHFEDGIDFININDIQEYFNWNKLYTEQERRNIYLRWKRKTKREENRGRNLERYETRRRRRRRRDGCPLNLPNCNIQGGGKRRKKTRKKQFLYNPNDPSKSFDVYIDKNPNDTIPIKYTTVKDVEDTIKKLERLYKTKKYPHKRIWQVGMIMKVRLEAMNKYKKTRYPNAKNVFKRYQLSKRYFKFLGERSKKKSFDDRKKMTFNINMKKKKTRKGGGKKKRRTTRKKRGGVKMKETIVKFKRGPYPKKYTAIVKHIKSKKTRKIHFGDRRYQQYKDRTPLKLYKSGDHNTIKRMQNYFSRHSGTKNRGEAIEKEKKKSNGLYNAKILSHVYLW